MEFAERAPTPKIVHIKLGKFDMKLWSHRMQLGIQVKCNYAIENSTGCGIINNVSAKEDQKNTEE